MTPATERGKPEEAVRQALIRFLVKEIGVPRGLISVERAVKGSGKLQRYDLVVHDRNGGPWLLVECKAPGVRLSQSGFDQLGRYNRYVGAPYLMISNGTEHFCMAVAEESGKIRFLDALPSYPTKDQPNNPPD